MSPSTYAALTKAAKKKGLRLGAWLDELAGKGPVAAGSAREMQELLALMISIPKDERSKIALQKRTDALGDKLGFLAKK